MKKIIVIFLMCLCLSSCAWMIDKTGKCQINYSIVYPDTTIIYDSTFYYRWAVEHWNTHIPYTSSYKGTNYIKIGMNAYVYTTSPIRINSYKTISKDIDHEKIK